MQGASPQLNSPCVVSAHIHTHTHTHLTPPLQTHIHTTDYNPTDEEIAHIQHVLTSHETDTEIDTHIHTHAPLTSLEMYQAQKQAGGSRRIITFCKAIDTMLGGGVQRGQVTEICTCFVCLFVCMMYVCLVHLRSLTYTHTTTHK